MLAMLVAGAEPGGAKTQTLPSARFIEIQIGTMLMILEFVDGPVGEKMQMLPSARLNASPRGIIMVVLWATAAPPYAEIVTAEDDPPLAI